MEKKNEKKVVNIMKQPSFEERFMSLPKTVGQRRLTTYQQLNPYKRINARGCVM